VFNSQQLCDVIMEEWKRRNALGVVTFVASYFDNNGCMLGYTAIKAAQ